MMKFPSALRNSLSLASALTLALFVAAAARAQDGRITNPAASTQNGVASVAEPTFPATLGCSTVAAETTIQSSGEPASETVDTLIQPALTAAKNSSSCKVVELTLNSNGNDAFVINPIAIPTGVTLVVDGGVTVFATLNASAYQVGTVSGSQDQCGINGNNGNGCYALISLGQSSVGGGSSSTGSALMGYGVINGRGYDAPTNSSGVPLQSNCGSNGTTACTWWQLANNAQTNNNSQNNFILVQTNNASSLTVYKITLENSPMFHMKLNGGTGITVWGLKIITPWTGRNTDGVDPTGVTNMSIVNSVIGDGDDEVALSGSSATTGVSITNMTMPSGHGVSIGSYTGSGVSNVLATNLNFSGQALDGNQIGLRIKSQTGRGGLVNNITYNNVCMQNVATAIDLNPYYNGSAPTTASGAPTYTNITYQNLYVLTSAKINLQGFHYSTTTNTSTITLNNVYVNSSSLNLTTNDGVATPSYDNITLAGTSYYPNAWSTLSNGTVTETTSTPAPTLASSFPSAFCSGVFPTLVGELYATSVSGGTTTNLRDQAFTVTNPATITLNGMLQPVNSEVSYTPSGQSTGYTKVSAPSTATLPIQFYDGSTLVGTGTLAQNGTFVTAPVISNPSVGTHTYTAKFQGDSNYSAFTFGSLTVTVNAGASSQLAFTAAPPSTLIYGTAPGTVTVAVEDSVGDVTTSTASVTLTVTGPNSYSHVYTASAVNGTATFSLTSSLPGVGSYGYVASSSGLTSTGTASETVSAATLTVTAQPASRLFGDPNPSFPYQITGYVNSDSSSVVSGTPVLTTTAARNSPATTYPITATVGTLAAANYNFATIGNTLTVNGGAPQTILFAPLPNLMYGGVYQLTALSTSGLPVTYSVLSGGNVSGSTLRVTAGSGQTVTVTAMQAGNNNYAAAPNVQQSFVAQSNNP
jgi:polygalacturonase